MSTQNAVSRGSLEDLKKALIAGASADEFDRMRRTPLMYTAVDNQLEFAEVLLGHGANPNSQDTAGWTALHFAAQSNSDAMARLLIKSGAILELRDSHGNTPLARATFSYSGKANAIEVLLEAGADPYAKNNHDVSPLSLAHTIANYDTRKFFARFKLE